MYQELLFGSHKVYGYGLCVINETSLSSDRWHSSNIELSGLSIVVTCDKHVLVYQCVTKSCDSPDWLVQPCIIRRHHVLLERFYDLAINKTFQNVLM